ncbi:MAG: hypothetical protein ACD_3C00037G0005 [uncultured bacterium (gcode 4)]|uniref:Polymerase/histidinol phosphatase N-terminal domain-containing protein n=1 Tax=uncultured bacterium (gcode 4) TaxID=1234023 RepID=K2GEG7_9BACT|nr:MAG: hypothetical protein ACD_3C00037G0005 [uncultured bacterium (gcode 4)]
MKDIRLDQHIHSSLSYWEADDTMLLETIKALKLDFAAITDYDNVNHQLQQKIESSWVHTCSGVEMSVVWPEGNEMHILLYAKCFSKWISDILAASIEWRKNALRKKMQSLNDCFFEIDEECFLNSVRAKTGESYRFDRHDLAKYIFSINKHRNKVIEIVGEKIDAVTFWEQFLEDYDEVEGKGWKFHYQYLPSLQEVMKFTDNNTVISLAHPQRLFRNTQEFKRRIWQYVDLGINALEISATAHKAWEHDIIRAKKEHWVILTFWGGSDSDKIKGEDHKYVWRINPELDAGIVLENYRAFKKIINS